jgi:hypothetical protein
MWIKKSGFISFFMPSGREGEHPGMTISEIEPIPICPRCEGPMRLERVTPRLGANPELRTYVCQPCHEVLTFSDDGRE